MLSDVEYKYTISGNMFGLAGIHENCIFKPKEHKNITMAPTCKSLILETKVRAMMLCQVQKRKSLNGLTFNRIKKQKPKNTSSERILPNAQTAVCCIMLGAVQWSLKSSLAGQAGIYIPFWSLSRGEEWIGIFNYVLKLCTGFV